MSNRTIFFIVFFIHLIPVIYIATVAFHYPEGAMGWFLFLLIDFPLSWLFIPLDPLVF